MRQLRLLKWKLLNPLSSYLLRFAGLQFTNPIHIRRIYFIAILFSAFSASAQNAVDVHSQLWMSANYKFDLGSRSQVVFDGSLRTADLVSQWKQQIIRFNYLYQLNKFQVGGGFLFSNAYSYSSTPIPTKEYRPFLHLSKRIGVINLRARWETRLFDRGNDIEVYNRFRVQVRYQLTIGHKTKSQMVGDSDYGYACKEKEVANLFLVFSDEPMYQSRKFDCFGFDQNRTYVGIKWEKPTIRSYEKKFSLEFGYAGQLIRKSAGKYEWDNMFMLMFSGN